MTTFDLENTYLGLDGAGRVTAMPGGAEFWRNVDQYASAAAGALVTVNTGEGDWTSWEIHPHGDEVLVVLEGHARMISKRRAARRFMISRPALHSSFRPAPGIRRVNRSICGCYSSPMAKARTTNPFDPAASNEDGQRSQGRASMPRKLKTYITTSGFFDIAVAAPSMSAALSIWGNRNNLFQQGLASESKDPAIVKATLEHPGIVLRRAVGGTGPFKEQAALPKLSVLEKAGKQKSLNLQIRAKTEKTEKPSPPADTAAANRKAAQMYDLAQRRREQDAQRAEADRQKERERRERAVEKAQAALQSAREKHEDRLAGIEVEREKLDRRAKLEKERWEDEKEELEETLKQAGR